MSIILIRAMHPTAYRSGAWGVLSGVYVMDADTTSHPIRRPCYSVYFPNDGAEDFWPITDTNARYEFDISDNLSKVELIKLIDFMDQGRKKC